tara:strand:+ start:1783 stop:2562 length:780 start_codon:yes stop_codon:yes gene_type:complete
MELFGIFIFLWFLSWLFGDNDNNEEFQSNQPVRSNPSHRTNNPSSGYLSFNYQEEIGIKLAMSIAMADGKLHKSEATVINKYMKSVINSDKYYDSDDFKNSLNNSLVSAKTLSDKNQLKTASLCRVAANNFDEQHQFQTLQLCLDVMVADGKANRQELMEIDKIADKIGVYNGSENVDFVSLRDKALIQLKPSNAIMGDSIDEKLGIKKSWSKQKKRKFIAENFTKWNGRLANAKSNREQKNIKNLLKLLSDAYEKYEK